MRLRRPSFPEILAQLVLVLLLALFVQDYIQARTATACGTPGASSNCYPWGGEGPVAGGYAYSSKEAYLRTGLWLIALLTFVMLAPFVVSRAIIGIVAMILLALLSFWAAEVLARVF